MAVFKSTMIARRGIAISASPNPKVERTKVARKSMLKTGKADGIKSILKIKAFDCYLIDERPMLTIAFGFVKKYRLTKDPGLHE